MINLKYGLFETIKRPKITILIVIQLCLCMFLTYNITNKTMEYNYKNKDVYKSLKGKTVYDLRLKYPPNEYTDKEATKKIKDYVYSNSEFRNVYISKYITSIKSFEGIEKFEDEIIDANFKKNAKDGYTYINAISVDKNFFSSLEYTLSDGNLNNFLDYFRDNDKYSTKVPVILGNAYKKYFSVGDIIKGELTEFQVEGFLSKDQFCTAIGSSFFPEYMKNLNNFTIVPECNQIISGSITGTTLIFPKDYSGEIQEELDRVISKGDEVGCPVIIMDPAEEISIFNENISYEINIDRLLLVIVSIFMLIGITTTFTTKISNNEKEYAIHLLNGATLYDIVVRTFYDIIITVLISATITGGVIVFNGSTSSFNGKAFGITLLVFLIISIVLSIIPSIKILKYNIAYLTKGEE